MKYLKYFNQVNEGINDTKFKNSLSTFAALLLSPITLPILANLSTQNKIELLIRSITNNYLLEKAEYNILDEAKYDVEQPSILSKIWRRLKMIRSKMKTYPTLEDSINATVKIIKVSNFINFKNKEDKDYICDQVREFFSKKTEDEWIKILSKELKFDIKSGKVITSHNLKNPEDLLAWKSDDGHPEAQDLDEDDDNQGPGTAAYFNSLAPPF